MRSLTVAERLVLKALFGVSLDVNPIGLGSSMCNRPWSPYGNRISLPDSFFKNNSEHDELELSDPYTLSVFAHEALHVWQRQHGAWVTICAAVLQLGRLLRVCNPYKYDSSITDPMAMLRHFEKGSVERQGQIFQRFVYDLQTGKDTARYCGVWNYIRNRSR